MSLILGSLLIPVAIVGGLGAFITFLVHGTADALILHTSLRIYVLSHSSSAWASASRVRA